MLQLHGLIAREVPSRQGLRRQENARNGKPLARAAAD
jgi:hypothetical protein